MASRKFLYLLSSILVFFCVFVPANAGAEIVFGPSNFEISNWHFHLSRHVFNVDDPGDGLIKISKNTPDMDIEGGFLFFNLQLIPLRDFLIGDDIVIDIEKSLKTKNSLTVFLRGTPGASVAIEVENAGTAVPPPEITFSADPVSILFGDSSTLIWQTTNADSASIDQNIGNVSVNGSEVVVPLETTTYTLTAVGTGGTTTASITITVTPLPPTVALSAAPMTILVGNSATLSWTSDNAVSCVIEPDVGVVDPEGSVVVAPNETTTYTIVASGDGGTATDEVTVTVNELPPAVEIVADPATVLSGETTTLTWTSSNAASCLIEPGIGTVETSGSTTVTLSETTTYTITATGPGGTATSVVTVTVFQPPTASLAADPETILLGASATLTWNTTGAESVSIDPGIGTVDANGSVSVSPADTTTYTITASGPGGTTTDTATIKVIWPPTVTISADPDSILLGESATLSWSSTNADSCTIEPGIGVVATSGSMTVSPTATTTYTITATGSGGTATAQATVTVTYPAPSVSLSADPATIVAGESTTLAWSSTNADSAQITPDIGTVQTSGSVSVSPTDTTTYTITVTGPGGTAAFNVTVTVLHLPTVTISVSPGSILLGESATLSWSSTNADSCTIEPGIGVVATSGSMTVYPTTTTTYAIIATGPAGTVTNSVDVTVIDPNAPPTVSINPSSTSIAQGGSAILSWTSTNADSAFMDNGIGSVQVNGSIEVFPEHTTTYTLTVTGNTGSANAQAVVMVNGNPDPLPEGSFGEQYDDLFPPDATVEEYDAQRFALITGSVQDASGIAIAGVSITIHGHEEYGTAFTDEQGVFTIPVEGGAVNTVVYQKSGLITAQRQVDVPWNDIAIVETIQMLAEDPASTTVTFDGNSETVVTHQSTPVSDEFGTRSATMVFTGDNRAWLVDENGNDVMELTTVTTHATEYATPESMPAKLPPNSAYTYCAELSVDGVQRVRFEKPIVTWVDNFLGFDVGEIVPVGYYDRDRGVWVPSDNGVVVRLLDTDSDGVVDALDADGDDQPDDLNGNGLFNDEVQGLDYPGAYLPGATFWRVTISHFTPWDCNWPYGPPQGAIASNAEGIPHADQQIEEEKDCKSATGSFVEERSRIFHEDISIPGTDITLHYASNRVEGYQVGFYVPVSGETIPAILKNIIVKVKVAGRLFEQHLDPLPDQKATFYWDGLDSLGRPVNGPSIARIMVGFVYDAVYYGAGNFNQAFAQAGDYNITGIRARQEVVLWKESQRNVFSKFNGKGIIAEGWTLSSHHRVYPIDKSILYKGDGTILDRNSNIIRTVVGTGTAGLSGDDGPAVDAQISNPTAIAIDAVGNLFIACGSSIRKVDIGGIITTVAGGRLIGFSGDGGLATNAKLNGASGVAVDSAGNLYIADTNNNRIRKVDTEGIITTVAGNGNQGWGFNGEGGIATSTPLNEPRSVAVDDTGNIFICDHGNLRIRKVDTNGIITTVAGNGVYAAYNGDGGLATNASLPYPAGIDLDRNGNLFIADTESLRVFRVDTSGIITTVAGGGSHAIYEESWPAVKAEFWGPIGVQVDDTGNIFISDLYFGRIFKVDTDGILTTVAGLIFSHGFSGDGGPPKDAYLCFPYDVSFDNYGNLYIADSCNNRIRKVDPPLEDGDLPFAEENGLAYIMSTAGRHESTIELDTGVAIREFGYDENNNLISITDQFGNQTTIDRYPDGTPASITSPDGLTTQLTIDADNHLMRITYPDDSPYNFEYTPAGLLTAKVEPNGNRFEHQFSDSGRLTDATDDDGGHWHFTQTDQENGDILTEVLTGEGNLTTYLDHTYSTGEYISTITDPTGAQTLFNQSYDSFTVNKSLPCGMDLEFKYDLDSEYKLRFVKEMTETTPNGLARVTLREKNYEDTSADGLIDLITDTVTVNGKSTTVQNSVLDSQKTVTSPEGRTVTSNYDPANLLTNKISVPELYDTDYSYDAKGRVTSITINTRQTGFTYDSSGNLQTVTDPENHLTTYDHDAVGRITAVYRPDASNLHFSYDDNGNMTLLTNPSDVDFGFGYNGVNLNDFYQTPLSGSYSYLYDADRRLIQTTFPSGKQIINNYDTIRLTQIQTPEGNIDYTYLCSTKIESITKGTQSITFGYDGKLVTSEAFSGTLNQSLVYTYNNDFNVTGFTYAGASVAYGYDNDGLLTTAGAYSISRNANSGLPENVTGGALNMDQGFNGYGELSTQNMRVNGNAVVEWSLTRDDNGRITDKTETIAGLTSNYVYGYDPMGRLETVTKDGALVESYGYDLDGTRTSESNTLRGIAGRTLAYSDEDHLLTTGSASYQYDLDGFLINKLEGPASTSYQYSIRGELLQVDLPDARVITYEHDPLGRRIAKRIDGAIVEKYLWQGLTRLLAVYDGADNLVQRFSYADGRMPVAMTQGGVTYYLGYDQVGSLRLIADAAGNVVKRIDYDSFGNIIADTNSGFTVPFGFAGGLHDRDTSLVRFGYRDYDPDTGRWTAKDPIGFAGGDTDLFGYVQNNPVNFADPYGLIRLGRFVTGFLSVSDGAIMVTTAFGATVGTAVLTKSPSITGVVGLMMTPLAIGGYYDMKHGIHLMIEAIHDEKPLELSPLPEPPPELPWEENDSLSPCS